MENFKKKSFTVLKYIPVEAEYVLFIVTGNTKNISFTFPMVRVHIPDCDFMVKFVFNLCVYRLSL